MHEKPSQPEPTSSHPAEESASPPGNACSPSRREFVRTGSRLLVYSAPLVQLFHTKQALAGSGATGSGGKKSPVQNVMGTIDIVDIENKGPLGTLKTYE